MEAERLRGGPLLARAGLRDVLDAESANVESVLLFGSLLGCEGRLI